MADQTSKPGSGDVADERGEITPGEMPGHAVIAPDAGIDAPATHESSGLTPSGRRTGTQGALVEDLADPEADANVPDPSKPISMSTGPVNAIRSGSHVTEDDTAGRPPGSDTPAEHPRVGQPVNVAPSHRP